VPNKILDEKINTLPILPGVDSRFHDNINASTSRKLLGKVSMTKPWRPHGFELQLEMRIPFAHRPAPLDSQVTEEHSGSLVAPAGWLHLLERLNRRRRHLRQAAFCINRQRTYQIFHREMRSRMITERLLRRSEAGDLQTHPSCHGMAATCGEVLTACLQRIVNGVSIDTSSRSTKHAIFDASEQNGWPCVFLDKPRAHDSDNPRVPLLIRKHNHATLRTSHAGRFRRFACLALDLARNRLPLRIDL